MRWAYLFLALFFFVGCSENSSSSGASADSSVKEHPGMKVIASSGKFTYLGTNETAVKSSERPRMKVIFDYDYKISSHEVTCSEFNALMKLNVDCGSDSLPAANVNYYDALLFSNERSKAEKLDTVYTYSAANFDENGHCVGLEGLVFNTGVEGFRLPTEAEWVYAASEGWNAKKSWSALNSDFVAHEVCHKSTQVSGLCDMAGNMKEWVYGWLGNFREEDVSNYVGAQNGNALGERILKGGSFRDDPASMNLYSRGDTYVVTSTSQGDYVGFRLAMGAIPSPTWMNEDGEEVTSVAVPLLSPKSIQTVTGTFRTKLVFRNHLSGNLSYIDYSSSPLTVVEIRDTLNSFHPDISPDGRWVAFCTGLEGTSEKSQLYVRRLDPEGSALVQLNVEGAAIPRFRVRQGDTSIVYVSSAANNIDRGNFLKESTWEVPFSNGKFGTPKKLFDGAYHGGVNASNNLAVTGARLLRSRQGDSSRVWYDSLQACNVSLAKDGSDRTLFLDFAGKTGKSFVGTSYGIHERLLIADSSGRLVQSVASPDGYAFDHTEWSNRKNLAVATLTDVNGIHQKISIINTTDSTVTNLVEGEELWHPAFWVDGWFENISLNVNLDSAGQYMKLDDSWSGVLMRYNMELLWRYRDSVNVAIVGSSRPFYSISPSLMSRDFFAVNFSHTPNSIYASRDHLEKYLFTHLKNLKYVVVSVDIDFWWKVEGDNFFASDMQKYPGYVYDANHDFWKDSVPAGLLQATEKSLGLENSYLYTEDRGRYLATPCASWGDVPEVEFDSTYYDDKPELLENSLKALEEIIQDARERDIEVVGIIFPQSPDYRNTGAFGRYGLRRSVARETIEKIKKMEEDYSNFHLMDENKMGNHDYAGNMAVDNDHLCGNGAPLITSRLDSLLLNLKRE